VALQPARFQCIHVASKVLLQFEFADFGVFQQLAPAGDMSQVLGTFLYCGNNLVSAHSLLLSTSSVGAQPPSAAGISFGVLPLAKYQ
jgi:hypothetical protein